MKLFAAALACETNTFSPIPTCRGSFSDYHMFLPGEMPDSPFEFAAPVWVARQQASLRGWDLVEGTCAGALPGGVVVKKDYEGLRDEILAQLSHALPVDAVVLSMHGAMVADGYFDCEGDMLARVRKFVGPDVVVGLEIDPHCHLTELMTESADVIVLFKEYPHTDFVERAQELLDIVEATVLGRCRPVMAVFDCRMLGIFHTTREPMRSYMARLREIEREADVLSISVAHGFLWGDVPEGGTRILVITDAAPSRGAALAEELGKELYALRGMTSAPLEPWRETLEWAMAQPEGPIVLADSSDNPGGGAPGDSTWVLRHLIESGADSACVGPLWDPMAVRLSFAAGVGASFDLRIGGKTGPSSGEPLDATVLVTGLCREARQHFAGTSVELGDCAAVNIAGVDVVLSSLRNQALGCELFTNVGVDLNERKLVVVKSSQHFYDAFSPIAVAVKYLDTPGALTSSIDALEYQHLPMNIWPFNTGISSDS